MKRFMVALTAAAALSALAIQPAQARDNNIAPLIAGVAIIATLGALILSSQSEVEYQPPVAYSPQPAYAEPQGAHAPHRYPVYAEQQGVYEAQRYPAYLEPQRVYEGQRYPAYAEPPVVYTPHPSYRPQPVYAPSPRVVYEPRWHGHGHHDGGYRRDYRYDRYGQ